MKDPPIARAYAIMLARPGAAHSVSTLAEAANLSRSAFMARFSQALGCSPMLALRQARMQRAASLLAVSGASLEQVARSLGYKSTSSFARAFHSVLGKEPYDVRRALAEAD
jgi:AraC family transcriptional activator of mtrCDE